MNSASAGRFPELLGAGGGKVCIGDLIHPLWWGGLVSFLLADLVPYEWFAARGGRVPRNAGNDEVPVLLLAWELIPRAEKIFQEFVSGS